MKAYQEAEQNQEIEGSKEIEEDQTNQGTDAIFGERDMQHEEQPPQDYQPPDLGMFGGDANVQQPGDQPFPADASFPISDAFPSDQGFQTGGDVGFQQDAGFQQPDSAFDSAFGGEAPMAQDSQGQFWNQQQGQPGMWDESGLPSDIVG